MERRDTNPPTAHERWKPENHEEYFVVLGSGEIQSFQWNNTDFDRVTWDFGNCFKNDQMAEQARDRLKEYLLTFYKNLDDAQTNG
jgi:hypothetical protein